MTLDEIKEAVDAGKPVHWANERYKVIKDIHGRYLITCEGGSTIGLTWQDGVTMNGEPEQFFIGAITLTLGQRFNEALKNLDVPGYSQFYHIAIMISGARHPLFGTWYLIKDTMTGKDTWCDLEFHRNDLTTTKRTAKAEDVYTAIEEGYVTLAREAKQAYERQYPTTFIEY